MAKTKEQKEEILNDFVAKINDSKSVIFASFTGLKVNEFQSLRQKCRENGVECKVVKKTLLEKGIKDAGFEGFNADEIDNGVALFFGLEDEVAPAKAVKEFSKDYDFVKIYGGILTAEEVEEKILSKDAAMQLANLPSKQELYTKMVGSLNAPVSGFVNVLSGNLRGLVQVLNAIKDKKA